MFNEMLAMSSGGGGSQVKAASNITVTTSGNSVNCGFRPDRVWVCMNYGTTHIWWLVLDDKLNIDDSYIKGTVVTHGNASSYITITSTGFTIKSYSSAYDSSSTNIYRYIAVKD